ncbi:3-deoxy-D-manno-octulosonic acid transferase [Rheinheimera salexigens]
MKKIVRFIVPEPLRWCLYSVLHRFINGRLKQKISTKLNINKHYTWIFCSTIGELNACKLLVQHYCNLGNVLLLTDREIYLESFNLQFPNAEVAVLNIDFRDTAQLMFDYPSQLAIVCEIPALLHDAPCRLSYGVLRTLKKYQVPICLVNGWLYGYKPACKQDSIEKLLFEQDYLNCFDLLSVQTEQVKQTLLANGAETKKVVVTGNMKYDNLDVSLILTEQTQGLLHVLQQQHSPLFVAGCVTNVWEYQLVVSAYVKAKQTLSTLKLIIAPRHPEKPEQLTALEGILQQYDLQYDFKSKLTTTFTQLKDVLIVDTFGQLKALYSVADTCYVGMNHNILEPLSLNKPVMVLDNWEKTYPSYPVFEIAVQAKMITVLSDESALAECIINQHQSTDTEIIQVIRNKLKQLSGACSKNIELIKSIFTLET